MNNFLNILPAVPRVPRELHYTAVIDGGYHGLYSRLPQETQWLMDEWGYCAAGGIFPILGWPVFSDRNLRGTVVQATIVANGQERVSAETMVGALLRGHLASVARREAISWQVAAEGSLHGHELEEAEVMLIVDRVADDIEAFRGGIDPALCDFEATIVQPAIQRHVENYFGDGEGIWSM